MIKVLNFYCPCTSGFNLFYTQTSLYYDFLWLIDFYRTSGQGCIQNRESDLRHEKSFSFREILINLKLYLNFIINNGFLFCYMLDKMKVKLLLDVDVKINECFLRLHISFTRFHVAAVALRCSVKRCS